MFIPTPPPSRGFHLFPLRSFLDKTSVEERLHVPIGVKQKKHIRVLLGIDHYGAQVGGFLPVHPKIQAVSLPDLPAC